MTITIPTSTFAAKIIREEYGNDDSETLISIDPRDHLWKYLLYRLPEGSKTNDRAHTTLTDHIELAVTGKIRKRLLEDLWQVGLYLHEHCRQRLLHFVEAQTIAGVQASKSIEIFYAMYEIDEDDYSRDAAYRLWQRYISKKKNYKKIKKWGKIYINNKNIKMPSKLPLNTDQVQDIANRIVKETLVYWFTEQNEFRYSQVEQLLTYLYIREVGQSEEEVARRACIHPRSVYKRLRKWDAIMDTIPSINNSYHSTVRAYTLNSQHDNTSKHRGPL
jgi:hypothetical protein